MAAGWRARVRPVISDLRGLSRLTLVLFILFPSAPLVSLTDDGPLVFR